MRELDELVAAHLLSFRDDLLFQSPSTRNGRVAKNLLRQAATNLANAYQARAKSFLRAAKGGLTSELMTALQRPVKRSADRGRQQFNTSLKALGFGPAQIKALTPLIYT